MPAADAAAAASPAAAYGRPPVSPSTPDGTSHPLIDATDLLAPVPAAVNAPYPGMYTSLLDSLTPPERAQLLQDTIYAMGARAFYPVVESLMSPPLSQELDSADEVAREDLIHAATRNAPQWMVCKYLLCPHHDHEVVAPSPSTRATPSVKLASPPAPRHSSGACVRVFFFTCCRWAHCCRWAQCCR